MSADVKVFFQKVPYPIYVLTSFRTGESGGGEPDRRYNGSVVTWATQVEATDPARVAVAVAKSDYTYEFVEASRAFALHLLGHGGVDLAKHFGFQSGRKVDKFAAVPFEIGVTGAPVLKDALGYVECRVVGALDTGPHVVFVGEAVGGAVRGDGEPLMMGAFFAAIKG